MVKPITFLVFLLLGYVDSVQGQESRHLSIGELFRIADTQNADIRASEASIRLSRQGERVAQDSRLPQINASVTLSFLGDGTILDRNFGNAMGDRLPHFSNNIGVEVYQPIYTGGAITSGISLASRGIEMAENHQRMISNSVRMAIVHNYLELAKQRNLLQVYEKNIALTERLIGEMKLKHAEGIVLKNDITRYELRLSSLSYDKLATENAIRIINHNLASLLGWDESIEVVPNIEADGEVPAIGDFTDWLQSATNNAPSLKSLDIETSMTQLDRKIAYSDYIPKIGLIAGDNLVGPITFEVPAINKNYNAWFVGVNVKWNISSLFTTRTSTRKLDYKIAEIALKRDATASALNRDICEALTLYRQSMERLGIERKNVELAEENYRVVANRFDNQLALLTDMLDASNSLLDADVRNVNAGISTRFYYYQLHYLAGTLSTL